LKCARDPPPSLSVEAGIAVADKEVGLLRASALNNPAYLPEFATTLVSLRRATLDRMQNVMHTSTISLVIY
jgi:hypothetical protein